MRAKQFPIVAAVFALCWGAGIPVAFAIPVPALEKPSKFVTDRARVLPLGRASALNEKLAQFERDTSNQILVYVEPKIPEGTTLEELANSSFHAWGVGQKGKSNGLVFFIFPQDRKMRIEVGYALEGAIPDARSHRITDEIVKPFFRQGDFAGGIEAGADALMAAARGEPFKGTGRTVAEGTGRTRRGAPASGILFAVVAVGCGCVLLLFIFLFVARRNPNSRAARRRFMTGHGRRSSASMFSSTDSSSSSSDSSDSSSSSSSDFSGGGGDSGGGGSSDSW